MPSTRSGRNDSLAATPLPSPHIFFCTRRRFVDLATMAKVSVLILDEKYHGWYLHCRSPYPRVSIWLTTDKLFRLLLNLRHSYLNDLSSWDRSVVFPSWKLFRILRVSIRQFHNPGLETYTAVGIACTWYTRSSLSRRKNPAAHTSFSPL